MADSSFFMMSGRSLLRFYFPGQTFQNFNDFLLYKMKIVQVFIEVKERLNVRFGFAATAVLSESAC